MLRIKIEGLRELSKELRRWGNERRTRRILREETHQMAKRYKLLILEKNFKKREDYPSTHPLIVPSPSRKLIKRIEFPKSLAPRIGYRTGKLYRAIRLTSEEIKGGARVVLSGDRDKTPYFGLMFFGGVVKPRRRQYLAIPLQKESWGKSPLRFRRAFAKNGIIWQRVRGGYKPLYLLTKRFSVKPHPFMELDKGDIEKLLEEARKRILVKWFNH